MTSMIASIHEQCGDPDHKLSDLVQRSIFVATVLRDTQVSQWLRQELDGYTDDSDLPLHRQGNTAALLAWRPGLGWVEAPISDAQRRTVSGFSLPTGINELEENYADILRNGGCRCPLNDERQAEIRALVRLDTDLCLVVPTMAVNLLMQTVRHGIRDWSGALLEAGVHGQGSSFSAEEKSAAEQIALTLDTLLETARESGAAAAAEMSKRKSGLLSRLMDRITA